MKALVRALRDYTVCYTRGWEINYPESFHEQLRELLANLMEELGETIKKESAMPALPKLISTDWRVDLQLASNAGGGKIPKALVHFNLDSGKEEVQLTKA
jgi:hypothetical protein